VKDPGVRPEVLRRETCSGVDRYYFDLGSDPRKCVYNQPDFSNPGNLSFRIPTPIFWAGVIENIPDIEIVNNQASQALAKRELGISGRPNTSEDGSVGRFGWKACLIAIRDSPVSRSNTISRWLASSRAIGKFVCGPAVTHEVTTEVCRNRRPQGITSLVLAQLRWPVLKSPNMAGFT